MTDAPETTVATPKPRRTRRVRPVYVALGRREGNTITELRILGHDVADERDSTGSVLKPHEFSRTEAAQKWVLNQSPTGEGYVFVLMREVGIIQTTVDTQVKAKLL